MRSYYKEDAYFYIDDKPIKIVSGAIHYNRVVPEYWEDRLLKMKMMGLNTIETYVPWNVHEPEAGQYHFSDNANLTKFLDIAKSLDLYVILRPSPYICGEWEFGGLPYWLLKYPGIKLRSLDTTFMRHIKSYFKKLFEYVVPYQITNDGPIILMQVENEYGYYSNEKEYLRALIHLMKDFGVDVPIVTSDSTRPTMLKAGNISEEALPTVNCGSNLKERMEHLKVYVPNGPWMTMEFWIGWFDVWGKSAEKRELAPILKDFDDMLSIGHINIYMAHGGTNFGFWNGANYYEEIDGQHFNEVYRAATTSYDYGAPISEDGRLKESYYQFKAIIEKHTGKKIELPNKFGDVAITPYGKFQVKDKVNLSETLNDIAEPVDAAYPKTMEMLDQGFGYVLYRTQLGKVDFQQRIKLIGMHDRAQVFLNDQHQWTVSQQNSNEVKTLQMNPTVDNQLDILVENMGRTNFGPYLSEQHKGIKNAVMLDEYQHTGWSHYCLPLNNLEKVDFSKGYSEGKPSFYLVEFEVKEISDTYLNLSGWGKGIAVINGFNLGRYYALGPQDKLYVPGPVLKRGTNELIIFETEGKAQTHIEFVD